MSVACSIKSANPGRPLCEEDRPLAVAIHDSWVTARAECQSLAHQPGVTSERVRALTARACLAFRGWQAIQKS